MLIGAKSTARTAKVDPYFHITTPQTAFIMTLNRASSISAVFRAIKVCCTVVVKVTTPPLIMFLLDAGLGAFPIWSLAVVSGLAAGAAVAAGATVYVFLE